MTAFATSRPAASAMALLLAFLAAGDALAEGHPAPFAAGKAAKGNEIVERDCVGCHAQMFKGDAEEIYRRADRRVKTPAQLLAQVQACNVTLGKGYFPDEEEHIAAYLNLEFYKFVP